MVEWLESFKVVRGATTIWPNLILAKCQTVDNTPYSAARLATLVFLSAENFLYVPHVVAVPLSISGFYHWLYIVINSVNSWGWYGLCQRSTWDWQNSITITKTIIFFHMFVNFEILEQRHFVNV